MSYLLFPYPSSSIEIIRSKNSISSVSKVNLIASKTFSLTIFRSLLPYPAKPTSSQRASHCPSIQKNSTVMSNGLALI
jgi:hypothetical protein